MIHRSLEEVRKQREEAKQAAVRRILELAAQGEKIRTITATLNFEGHRNKDDGTWTAARVRTVLKSQARIEALRPEAEAALDNLLRLLKKR